MEPWKFGARRAASTIWGSSSWVYGVVYIRRIISRSVVSINLVVRGE